MQINSPLSPVDAKDLRPDWKLWLEDQIEFGKFKAWMFGIGAPRASNTINEGTKKICPESTNRSFCGCCGARWITAAGVLKAYNLHVTATSPSYPNPINHEGIYFAEGMTGERLAELVQLENPQVFEIKDGHLTHSFAWKDE